MWWAMLSPLDDTLWHQLPTTFDHVGTSDPRFFDRFWFASYEPNGHGALQICLSSYNNMNVVDGGFVVVHDGFQRNLRVSRSLRPRFEPICGPLRVDVVEPLQRFQLTVEPGDHPVHGELEWTAVMPPEEERPHFSRAYGRVVEDYQRFDQIGECSGWLDIEGHRVVVDRWWACRDHSWGVRPGMGVPEPTVGPTVGDVAAGFLFCFLFFSTDTMAGHIQLAERGGSRTYLTALLRDRRSGMDLPVSDVALSLELQPNTRRFRIADLAVTLMDGRKVDLRTEALGASIAMPGLGYSGGFDDGRGLGVWRAIEHKEFDVWDVRHPEDVIGAGRVMQPAHRIQPVSVQATGGDLEGVGTGSITLLLIGSHEGYGLD